MSGTYVRALLTLIGELFGPTNWILYKRYTLDILQDNPNAVISAIYLEELIENRPGVIRLHNDFALELYTGTATDLPCVGDGPGCVPPFLIEKFCELCQTYFAVSVQYQSKNMGDDVEAIDPAEIARQDAIAFLTEDEPYSPEVQAAIEAVLEGLSRLDA